MAVKCVPIHFQYKYRRDVNNTIYGSDRNMGCTLHKAVLNVLESGVCERVLGNVVQSLQSIIITALDDCSAAVYAYVSVIVSVIASLSASLSALAYANPP